MSIKLPGILLAIGIAILAIVIGLLSFPAPRASLFHQVLMAFALYGYMFLVLAALVLPFLREFVQWFGKPFLKIHHTFAFTGLVFITLHPAMFAYERMSLAVYIPNFSSWLLFWTFGGSVALIAIYIAFAAALLRKSAPKYWRYFHFLVYAALFFGIVHANLLGRNFSSSPAVTAIFNALFAASIVSLVYKRYQNYQLRKKMKTKNA